MSCIYICLVNQHSWAKNWTRQSSDILHNISSVCSVQSLTKPGYQADWELMGLYWVKSQRMQIKKKKKRKEHWTAVKKSWHFMMHQLLRKSYQKIYLLEISKEKYVPYSICHYWPNHRNKFYSNFWCTNQAIWNWCEIRRWSFFAQECIYGALQVRVTN